MLSHCMPSNGLFMNVCACDVWTIDKIVMD